MKKNLSILSLFFIISFFSSCNETVIISDDLLGKWEATSIFIEGEPLEIDYPITRLVILKDNTYQYSGTLNYKESGRWRLHRNFFITKDTLLPNALEKKILISNLTQSSFKMEIKGENKEQILFMIKSDL